MATQYTPILQLALPVTGELNGTWGDVVNDNITSMVEQAIAGMATISTWTANAHTLTTANGTTDEARCAMLLLQTGAGGTALSGAGQVICPALTKLYVVKNDAAYAVTVKTSGGSGVSVSAGDTTFVFCDGTNVVACVTQITNGHITGNLTVDGNTTLGDASGDTVVINAGSTTLNDGGALRFEDNAGGEYVALKAPATIAASFTLTLPIDDGTNGQALITDGSGNLSWSTAASGDVYGPASATDTAVALFDGTTGKLIKNSVVTVSSTGDVAGVDDISMSGAITLSGGTANGVPYLNGSKVLTTGSALTFDGADLNLGSGSVQNLFIINGGTTGGAIRGQRAGVNKWFIGDTAAALGSGTGFISFNYGAEPWIWQLQTGGEQMRLTSTGLGIGTSSPSAPLTFKANTGRKIDLLYNNASDQFAIGVQDYELRLASGAGSFMSFYTGGYTGGTEKMRLDSSGNLGLGVTPSAWAANIKAFDVGAGSALVNPNSNGQTWLATNAYYNAGWKYKNTTAATLYEFDSAHKWYTAPSGTAGNAISFTQAMTLDASGNLGIGTSSPSYRLDVKTADTTSYGIRVTNSNSHDGYIGFSADYQFDVNAGGAGGNWLNLKGGANGSSGGITLWTYGSERMRIDSSGNVGIGTSSPQSNLEVVSGTNGVNNGVRIRSTASGATGNWNINISGSNSLGFYDVTASSSPRAVIDSSGNLLVGYTSPYSVSGGGTNKGAFGYDQNGRSQIVVLNQTNGASAGSALVLGSYGTDWIIEGGSAAKTSNALTFTQNTVERMRIDSSGNLLVGATVADQTTTGIKLLPGGATYFVRSESVNANSTCHVYSTGAAAFRFYVGMGGTVYATNTTISAISDQRYKENIRDLDVGLNAVMALKPRVFDWKAGKGKDIKNDRGFIAQEFEQVFPDLIDEWKDPAPEGEEPYKSVRQDLIPVLVKAIQELKAELDAIKAELATLKAK